MSSRVLFASPCGPLSLVEGRDPLDPFTGQLSPTQGAYAMTMHGHHWAFYLMAENLRAECCVLEHPDVEEFETELRRGYDVLGLQLNWNTLRQNAEMIERARRIAPDTRIVVGGYALPQVLDPLPPDEDVAAVIRDGAHAFCQEEGVRFMRRLLGDDPVGRPITQYTLPAGGSHLSLLGPGTGAGPGSHPILVALGCPAGCDFCNTSAFFRRKKIAVADPEEVHRFMRHRLRARDSGSAQFELFDEDFFWEADFSRKLGRRLRDDATTRGRVGYFTFGSVRTLSRFDPEELAANGLGTVWIGVESTLPDALRPGAHLGKRKGLKLQALFEGLREVGIQTVGSLILGFDFHTPENVGCDVDAFLGLRPTVSQVTPLIPCSGTPLYERLKETGRLDPDFGWTRTGGFRRFPPVAPRHLSWPALQDSIEAANRRLFLELGPSALRSLDTALRGHLRLRAHDDPVLRTRSATLGGTALRMYPVLEALRLRPPSPAVEERIREVAERWTEAFGEPPEELRALGRALAERVRAFEEDPPAPPERLDAPTRWTWYRPGEPPRVVKKAA